MNTLGGGVEKEITHLLAGRTHGKAWCIGFDSNTGNGPEGYAPSPARPDLNFNQ